MQRYDPMAPQGCAFILKFASITVLLFSAIAALAWTCEDLVAVLR